jgi:segregation and condensation protein B
MSNINLKSILEAAILASPDPLSLEKMKTLFVENELPSKEDFASTLDELKSDYAERGVELVDVASGYRFQAKADFSQWLQRLWQQRPPRYSRALFETLALIAYKQPLTRSEIEEVRSVAVSSQIIKTLIDREWVRVVGHRDLPGKPALLATTKRFLDYFNLKKLTDLPPLSELMNFDELEKQLGAALPPGMKVENTPDSDSLEKIPESVSKNEVDDALVEQIIVPAGDEAELSRSDDVNEDSMLEEAQDSTNQSILPGQALPKKQDFTEDNVNEIVETELSPEKECEEVV